jgi:predicted MFS family arabinose efflux permease
MLIAILLWPMSGGSVALTTLAVLIWGLGCFSVNSSQQVRLVGMAPALSSASVSLNSSAIYLGQALGAFSGGLIMASQGSDNLWFFSAVPMALAIAVSLLAPNMRHRRVAAA